MASLISSMAKEIFQILKGTGRVLSLFDEHGNKVFEPESAISFFAEPDKLMLSIDQNGADSTLNMYISESADVDSMRKMIDTMRVTATRYNYLFNVRKYGKDLNPKDFAFKATPMMESMWGSAKTSYQTIGSTKLIIRHSAKISEDVRGARSRRIHSIFVETENGERFRCPMNSLHGARAYARHLGSGGTPTDSFSKYIFAECEMQGKINAVRKHIRKMQSTNEAVIGLSETLNGIVGASKQRIAKSKGNRFYTGIVEQITNAPNHVGPLAGEIAEQVEQLKDLLQIDETNGLVSILETVAKTILETRQMDPINFEEESLVNEFVAENAELIEDLIESLVGEFGLEEGVHFDRYAPTALTVLSEEAMDGATMYLQGFEGFTLNENPQDKFLMYATQWVKNRFAKAGMDNREVEQAGLQKQAAELATGLKQVIAGALSVRVKGGETPRFSSQEAAISFKLDKLLAPGSGLGNDMLWNYVSTLSDKLGNGDAMDQNERFFATKLADLVDKASVKEATIAPEMSALEEWMNGLDETAVAEAGPYDVLPMDSKVEQALDNFDLEAYDYALAEVFGGDAMDPEDGPLSYNAVVTGVRYYLETEFEEPQEDFEFERYLPQIEALVDEVIIPHLAENGFEVEATEGLDESLFAEGEELNEDIDDNTLLQLVTDTIASMDNSDFYGIVSGDDADDDAYALRSQLSAVIGSQLQSRIMDMDVDMIMNIARKAWSKSESLEEDASNHHIDDIETFIHDFISNPTQGMLKTASADMFDGSEDDREYMMDLVSDVMGFAIEYSENSFHQDFVTDHGDHFEGIIINALKQKFGLNEGEQLDERGEERRQADNMTLRAVIDTVPSFIKRMPGASAEEIFAEMEEYYMDSRTSGPVLIQNKELVLQKIQDKLGAVVEMAGADMGDDFVDDITHTVEPGDESEHLARLRKLAGL